MGFPSNEQLTRVYGESTVSSERFQTLAKEFETEFNASAEAFFTSPGRTEIIGNHTDHNGGQVIAGSVTMDTIGAASKNGTKIIRIKSQGYNKVFEIDIQRAKTVKKCAGTTSLIAGMVVGLQGIGYKVDGFDVCISSSVLRSAGMSSSASFEMLVLTIVNAFFNDNKMTFEEMAKIGQFSENVYWQKGSGLMDQMACAVGGPILLDFSKKDNIYQKLNFSFANIGHDMVIVNTGKGHADLSEEYSAVPNEMKKVAAALGVTLLAQTNQETLLAEHDKIEDDRAFLRALHFFTENDRVKDCADAMTVGDGQKVLDAITASGRSSYDWLQNCYLGDAPHEQKITRTLALTELFLAKHKCGACRVHGGGFAGVIVCIVPHDLTQMYIDYIEQFTGKESAHALNVRLVGATQI